MTNKSIIISTILIVATLIGGAIYLWGQEPITGGVISAIDFNGRTITMDYTDVNIDEDLIIRTDSEMYGGWNSTEIYFSIENVSDKLAITNTQFYFAGDEVVAEVSEFKENVPYEVLINDYGRTEYPCGTEWIATTTNDFEMEYTQYICGEETRSCDRIEGLNCVADNALIGNHLETRYRDIWNAITMTDSIVMKQEVPEKLKAKKKTTYSIPANGIRFFKAIIQFNPKSKGEFIILCESLDKKGKLK